MIAALMVAAGIFSQTIDVTFDMLVATPSRFDGSTVRLSGQIDSCWNFSCAICPKEATPLTVDRSKCLAIEFERGQPLLSKPIRYSDVTVTARCPECGGPVEEDAPAEKPLVVCRSCYEAPVRHAGR